MTGMLDGPLLVERNGAVVRLTLNRPEAGNAVTLELAQALVKAAILCDDDQDIRCVVLTGRGRMFCAGGDITSFATAAEGPSAFLNELAGTVHMAVARLARMSKPLLVLVNGPAAGAGLSLAALGDVVICGDSAHFTMAYTAIGLTPDGGASWLLPRLIGLRRAQEMILTNRRIASAEAEAIGLVTRTVPDSDLETEGAAMAERLSHAATGAIGASRILLLDSFGSGLETQMEREVRAITTAGRSSEGREGVASFIQKRAPRFEGK